MSRSLLLFVSVYLSVLSILNGNVARGCTVQLEYFVLRTPKPEDHPENKDDSKNDSKNYDNYFGGEIILHHILLMSPWYMANRLEEVDDHQKLQGLYYILFKFGYTYCCSMLTMFFRCAWKQPFAFFIYTCHIEDRLQIQNARSSCHWFLSILRCGAGYWILIEFGLELLWRLKILVNLYPTCQLNCTLS